MKEKSLRSTLWHFDFALSGLALTALIILTSVGVVARYFLHEPITWLEEVQMMLIVWTTFMGGSVAFRLKGHVAIEVVVELFPKPVQKVLRYIVFFFVLIVLAAVTREGINLMDQLIRTTRVTSMLHIPYALIYSAMPIGCVLMVINFILTEGKELFLQKKSEKKEAE